jgi:hypothetical protein
MCGEITGIRIFTTASSNCLSAPSNFNC